MPGNAPRPAIRTAPAAAAARPAAWAALLALAAMAALALASAACRGGPRAPGGPGGLLAQVDRLFAPYAAGVSPGCALAVVVDGRVALARGYGFADLARRLPITPRTVFDLASTSKQFTAACVLLLAESGRLSLDDGVRKYVPELPERDAAVTLRQLLHHTSGLPNYVDLLVKEGKRYEEVTTDGDALAALAAAPELEFAPGTAFHYNDSGYFLLSLVVKRVSGRSLRQFAAENLFAPLGMTDTRFVDDAGQQVPRRAVPYSPAAGGGFQRDLTSWEQTGDGGVSSTVLDLARWAASFDDPPPGRKALIAAMLAPGSLGDGQPLSYAGGLFLDRFHGEPRVRHPGSWRGFSAELMRLPDRRLAVITLCNRDDADPSNLCERVAELFIEARR
ncbi:MAG: beta-lactamase family protein [Acidobacteria bacterium]|nr:beta-lactamase family protein [Acidobacteriota bacterium]